MMRQPFGRSSAELEWVRHERRRARHHALSRIPACKQPYHLVDPSPWPIIGAVGGLLTVLGIIFAAHFGSYITLIAGAIIVLGTMFFWWRDVIRESRTPGLHTPVVRLGLRYGMLFFISSEVMFFVGFFWAFFNFALFPDTAGQRRDGVAAVHHPHLRSVPRAVPQHDDPAAVGHHDHLGASRACWRATRRRW